MSEQTRKVAQDLYDGAGVGYYSGTLGAKGIAGGADGAGAVTANLMMDVQRTRDVPPGVAARLNGSNGRGLLQMTRLTGARVHIENLAGLRMDDDHPRRVMVVGAGDDVLRCLDVIDEMVREEAKSVRQTVLCPAHCVGAVIGPGGAGIKGIQNLTGARAVVEGTRGSASKQGALDARGIMVEAPPRVISISGAAGPVSKAAVMVGGTREDAVQCRCGAAQCNTVQHYVTVVV
jgi:hypothetical protein